MSENILNENFLALITPDLYMVIAAVFGVCFALKSAKFFDDRFIPLAALVVGVAFELVIFAISGRNVAEFILKGIIAGMASVYIANIRKQMGGNGDNDI